MDDSLTHGERVKLRIIAAGLALWRKDAASVSARAIARQLGMTHAACLYHFGSAAKMRDAIACEAVRSGDDVVVPQLIVAQHSAAAALSDAERRRYLAGC